MSLKIPSSGLVIHTVCGYRKESWILENFGSPQQSPCPERQRGEGLCRADALLSKRGVLKDVQCPALAAPALSCALDWWCQMKRSLFQRLLDFSGN